MISELDRDTRLGALAFAVNEVLIDHGAAGLSLRRIGGYARMSPAAMLHHHRAAAAALECHARELLRQAPQPVKPAGLRRLLRGRRAPEAA